jgi:hypothetical protein
MFLGELMVRKFDAVLMEWFFVSVSWNLAWRRHIHIDISFDCIFDKMEGYLSTLP